MELNNEHKFALDSVYGFCDQMDTIDIAFHKANPIGEAVGKKASDAYVYEIEGQALSIAGHLATFEGESGVKSILKNTKVVKDAAENRYKNRSENAEYMQSSITALFVSIKNQTDKWR